MRLICSAFGDLKSGGGVFAVEGSQVKRLDGVSSMGLSFDGRRLARVFRCDPVKSHVTEVAIYDGRGVVRYMRLDDTGACHDVAWDGEDLLVVSSWDNAVRWFSPAGERVREIRYPGQIDSWHMNCITRHEGAWYVTLFGDFQTFRAWEPPSRRGQGKIVNLESGEAVVTGLTAPHSPCWVDGMWLVCNSEERELRAVDAASGQIIMRVYCGYWTRGLAFDESFFYVGGCQRRGQMGASFGQAQIIVIDRKTWEIVEQIPVPSQEVYNFALVPQEIVDGLERGFNVNPTRNSESRQYRILTELGIEQPRTLFPTGDPLPWSDFRSELACTLPEAARCGDLFQLPVSLSNRSTSFFTSAPPAPIYLSYKWLDPETGEYLSDKRAYRSPLPRTIFPGETIETTMLVITPDRPGAAILRIALVQEGVSWFDDQAPENAIERALTIAPPPLAAAV